MNKVFEIPPVFNKTTLKNGVRVLTEHHPNTRATTVGLFIPLGSRDEPHDLMGAAHFVEHMVFKGTKNRTAFDIVASLEAVGGELNAYTSREATCFHATTLREHLPLSLGVLTDLVSHATFEKEEFEKERQVILSEIDMSADDLEEYVFDLYFERVFNKHTLSKPILGTPESLKAISRKKLFDFYKLHYGGPEMIVSIAGAVDHEEAVKLVEKALGRKSKKSSNVKRKKPKPVSFQEFRYRNCEQVHVLMGQPSCGYSDKHRFESYIANAVLGGGMTSRLYQKIREKKALAYSVYSYLHAFTDSGLNMVYAGTTQKNLKKTMGAIEKEVMSLLDKGVSKKELEFFRKQVEGTILLGADDIENRMNSLGVNEMIFGEYRSVERVLDEISAVTVGSIKDYFQKYMDSEKFGIYILGDLTPEQAADHLYPYTKH